MGGLESLGVAELVPAGSWAYGQRAAVGLVSLEDGRIPVGDRHCVV